MVSRFPDRLEITALGARHDGDALAEQAERFRPRALALTDQTANGAFRRRHPRWAGRLLPADEEALVDIATMDGVDVVLNALVGAVGVKPTLAALRAGKRVALANKEALVAAGALVMAAAADSPVPVPLVPVDSEHSAIFQCLDGRPRDHVARIILTASGGPFREASPEELAAVTPEEALRHPVWSMGGKITVDSATLMNKGLEVIEAHWLFGVPPEAIDVWVHPQSVVHSLVELVDGSVLAQLGVPDMGLPIQYALTYPDRWPGASPRLDLTRYGELRFEPPRTDRFPSLALAYAALRQGGTMPTVLNAANEVAVELFLAGKLAFMGIPRLVEAVMDDHDPVAVESLEDVMLADGWARRRAGEMAGRLTPGG